ncbi:MAG: hypothetical protein HYT11_01245 [Candidatus Levybacteria bacterium]|nr:hypothetical protein [Candidatus Levybacteria bacterium]
MQNFDDKEAVKKIDPQDTVASTEMLVQQCEAAWNEVMALPIKTDYSDISNIVFCGMGASIYGALVLKATEGINSPFSIELISDYHLPAYVSGKSLIVLTSYSGSTEEVLSCAREALSKRAKMVVLTKGGALEEFAIKNGVPSYIFDGRYNPAGIPRLGIGYSILGLIGLLSKIKVLSIEETEIANAIIRLKEKQQDIKVQALHDYSLFIDKVPVIFAAQHLSGNAQIMRNQFNETSKTFSCYYLIPDLNHHLMEGLQFPKTNLQFILLDSPTYEKKIKTRVMLTIDVVKKNNHSIHVFQTSGSTFYDDFLETMLYSSYLTLYLALHYDQNPAVNPWVDYFKKKLAEG